MLDRETVDEGRQFINLAWRRRIDTQHLFGIPANVESVGMESIAEGKPVVEKDRGNGMLSQGVLRDIRQFVAGEPGQAEIAGNVGKAGLAQLG